MELKINMPLDWGKNRYYTVEEDCSGPIGCIVIKPAEGQNEIVLTSSNIKDLIDVLNLLKSRS